MKGLKKIEDIISSDKRTTYFLIANRETGGKREFDARDLHEEVELIELVETVAEEPRSELHVARNLCLYSWFSYSFYKVACLKAYSIIEMALRMRVGKPEGRNNLRALLEQAMAKGFLKVKLLPEAIAGPRNPGAYGSRNFL